jgi:hypothetical protein
MSVPVGATVPVKAVCASMGVGAALIGQIR